MEEKIKVSVVIKTKNSENTLCDTLESIKDFDEIIIIDEHSSDDTVDIAKEYKAKIIYADKNNLSLAFNQALDESANNWLFLLGDDEIVPQKLATRIENYILNPKKNRFCICLEQKTYIQEKEIKCAKNNSLLRVFKKDYGEFSVDYLPKIKLKQGKCFKISCRGENKKACILKFINPDFSKEVMDIVEKNRYVIKNITKNKGSLFIKPIFVFIYWYFLKGSIFDGKMGFIFAWKKYFEKLLLEISINEKRI